MLQNSCELGSFPFPYLTLKHFNLIPSNVCIYKYTYDFTFPSISNIHPSFIICYFNIVQSFKSQISILLPEMNIKHRIRFTIFLPKLLILVSILLQYSTIWTAAQEVGKRNKAFFPSLFVHISCFVV